MIKIEAIGQHCRRLDDNMVVADSVNFLKVEVVQTSEQWEGYEVSVIFENAAGQRCKQIPEENMVVVPAELIKAGLLYISLEGNREDELSNRWRITTSKVSVRIMPSGSDPVTD